MVAQAVFGAACQDQNVAWRSRTAQRRAFCAAQSASREDHPHPTPNRLSAPQEPPLHLPQRPRPRSPNAWPPQQLTFSTTSGRADDVGVIGGLFNGEPGSAKAGDFGLFPRRQLHRRCGSSLDFGDRLVCFVPLRVSFGTPEGERNCPSRSRRATSTRLGKLPNPARCRCSW